MKKFNVEKTCRICKARNGQRTSVRFEDGEVRVFPVCTPDRKALMELHPNWEVKALEEPLRHHPRLVRVFQ